MPRYPHVAPTLASMTASVFSALGHRIASLRGEVYPLHIGDSWLAPPRGAWLQDFRQEERPGLNRYARPQGEPSLLDALSSTYGVAQERILVTTGATGALDAIAGALLGPGDEVLLCAPFWPLIPGIVTEARARPVEVDVLGQRHPEPESPAARAWMAERLDAAVTPRTAALYVNSPHNPTGAVLTPAELAGVVDVARAHDLWIWSDAVYEHHAYARTYVSIATLAPERTFDVHSFSKAWSMAGYRCGFVIGPEDPAHSTAVRTIAMHTFYSTPTAAQLAATAALRGGASWMAECRATFRAAGDAAADRLGVVRPEGGTFLFLDVADHLDGDGLIGFLHRGLDRNLVLAPGTACGAAYRTHIRLCFTCVPPEVVARGVEVLAGLMGRPAGPPEGAGGPSV